MTEQHESGWQSVIGSSAILSLALLGDALIYAVLPIHADAFGLTLPWVGVMLSANRFVRVLAYGYVARLTYAIGIKRICIYSAILATVSTAFYGLSDGPAVILVARIVYGLSYAALLLVTLAYAVEVPSKVGSRVGVGRAIQRIGPIAVLIGGTWLVGWVGPTQAFVLLAIPSAISIVIALMLPSPKAAPESGDKMRSLEKPTTIDIIFFLLGYGVDGLFAISITLILATETSTAAALIGGGALLALRHVSEAVAAPMFGWFADKFGAVNVFIFSAVAIVLGFAFIALGVIVIGAVIMLIFRGAMASLGPALIVQSMPDGKRPLGELARMQAWRDLGAACGPLFTGFLLAYVAPDIQHAVFAAVLTAGFVSWGVAWKKRAARMTG